MNMFTVKMKLLTAVVLKEDAAEVKKRLLSLGIVDFRELLALTGAGGTSHEQGDERLEKVDSLLQQIESLYRQVRKSLPVLCQEDIDRDEVIDIRLAGKTLDSISAELSSIREKQKLVTTSLNRFSEILGYLSSGREEYLDIHIGSPAKGNIDSLRSRLSPYATLLLPVESSGVSIILSLSRERQGVASVIDSFNWSEHVDALSIEEARKALSSELEGRIEGLRNENRNLIASIQSVIEKNIGDLENFYRMGRVFQLLGYISGHFSSTRNTTIFSGWIPAETCEAFDQALKEVSSGVYVIEYTDEKEFDRKEIPVALDDIALLKPFQGIVKNYSTPQYGTVNPTVFVAISYLTMFALMFADAGQGFVIFLIGLIGSRRNRESSILRLMMYLGLASIASGALFGSYFGYPLLPPLWFDYHAAVFPHGETLRDVYSILAITLMFGIVVIYTGLLINWINLVRRRNWIHLVFEKNGLIGAYLYAVGIYISYGFVKSGYSRFPSSPWILITISVALIILFFRVPLEHVMEKKKGPFLLNSFMEWIVIILEIFSGYLSNTLSFMRVAGLGIAHVSLMAAFSEIASLSPNRVGSLLILVAGNILVIALEGLSAAIQSLRLNYYEFFTKFFVGEGTEYRPITLRSRSEGLHHTEHKV